MSLIVIALWITFFLGYYLARKDARQLVEVLQQLRDCPGKTELDLVKDSDGVLKRGTIYVALSRLEDDGLVESRTCSGEEEPCPRMRYYLRRDYLDAGA